MESTYGRGQNLRTDSSRKIPLWMNLRNRRRREIRACNLREARHEHRSRRLCSLERVALPSRRRGHRAPIVYHKMLLRFNQVGLRAAMQTWDSAGGGLVRCAPPTYDNLYAEEADTTETTGNRSPLAGARRRGETQRLLFSASLRLRQRTLFFASLRLCVEVVIPAPCARPLRRSRHPRARRTISGRIDNTYSTSAAPVERPRLKRRPPAAILAGTPIAVST